MSDSRHRPFLDDRPLGHCVQCWPPRSGERFCHRCQQWKPLAEFYRARRSGRVEAGCQDCRRTAARAWYRIKRGTSARTIERSAA